eukprot:3370234-Rhodomonas_salina.2
MERVAYRTFSGFISRCTMSKLQQHTQQTAHSQHVSAVIDVGSGLGLGKEEGERRREGRREGGKEGRREGGTAPAQQQQGGEGKEEEGKEEEGGRNEKALEEAEAEAMRGRRRRRKKRKRKGKRKRTRRREEEEEEEEQTQQQDEEEKEGEEGPVEVIDSLEELGAAVGGLHLRVVVLPESSFVIWCEVFLRLQVGVRLEFGVSLYGAWRAGMRSEPG